MRIPLLLTSLLTLFSVTLVRADAVWQWSVPVDSVVSSETKDHPRAFLYIPPNVRRVRAVVVGQHNLLEEPVLQHPAFRQALADTGMAEVWVSPAFNGTFRFDQGAGEQFNGMMKALARESGYTELEWAPVVPIGHSAMASYPYHFAAWNPARTLAAISLKGSWPDYRDANSPPFKDSDLNNVPLLYVGGEYEDANGRAAKAANFRKNNPQSPLTMLADSGGGHFDLSDRLVNYLGLYLRKLAQYRLPADAPLDGPVTLKPIDPTTSGWLYDRWRKDEAPKSAAAPVGKYGGNANEAFWAFDEELARATETYHAEYRGKKAQLLGYIQNGELLPQNQKAHHQVSIKIKPLEDGVTFKLNGTFLDTVPEGRPVGWSGLPVGSAIGHAAGGGPVVIETITGPLQKVGDDTFRIHYGRAGFNPRRGGDVWLQATHPGDGEYKRAVQQALLGLPVVNGAGADQSVNFPALTDVKAGTAPIKLGATASSGLPVDYYVQEGPAEIEGNTLRFTAIPPRARFPIKVTVVAYQWGRTTEPRLKTAGPIARELWIQPAQGPALPIPTPETTAAPIAPSASPAPAVPSGVPIWSENFNAESTQLDLQNGASLGADASGVSGKAGDRAYVAAPDLKVAQGGPVALLRKPIPVQGLDEITVTLWYKPGAEQLPNASLFDAASLLLIGDKPEEWTLRVGAKVEAGKQYWFYSGKTNPTWRQPNEWTFLALTWTRNPSAAAFYQGHKTEEVKEVRRKSQAIAPTAGLQERASRDRMPDTIGNTANSKYDRAFSGSIDNMRFWGKALDAATLEQIRRADLNNAPLK
jgi:hypothetical protein